MNKKGIKQMGIFKTKRKEMQKKSFVVYGYPIRNSTKYFVYQINTIGIFEPNEPIWIYVIDIEKMSYYKEFDFNFG